MFEFIFYLLLIGFIYYLVMGAIRLYRLRRQAREQLDAMRRIFRGGASQTRNRGAEGGNPWFDFIFGKGAASPAPEAPRKRIDPEVGEYVKFTETREPMAPTPRAPYRVEEQIEDIEWEEIK